MAQGVDSEYLRVRTGTQFSVWCLGSDIWTYGKLPILRYAVRRILRYGRVIFADGIQLAREAEALSGKRCLFRDYSILTGFWYGSRGAVVV